VSDTHTHTHTHTHKYTSTHIHTLKKLYVENLVLIVLL